MSDEAVAVGAERPARERARLDVERDIELVLDFLNTCDIEKGTECLVDPGQWQRWCAERDLGEPSERESARRIRDRMRATIIGRAEPAEALPPTWPVRIALRDGVPVLAAEEALGRILASAVHLVHTGHWDRIKVCPADDCLWAFYDRSRNRSRTWCAMKVCGNREKARSWRERHLTP